jgi:hypothetical protein
MGFPKSVPPDGNPINSGATANLAPPIVVTRNFFEKVTQLFFTTKSPVKPPKNALFWEW